MPYRPALKLRITGHLFTDGASPEAFAKASAVLDQARNAINKLGFKNVEVVGSVGSIRVDKDDAPLRYASRAEVEASG